jgi:hypothetical protein
MKQKHGAFFALVMAAVFTLAGCGSSDSGGDDEKQLRDELTEEDSYVNSIVIDDSENKAGMFFLSYPDSSLFASPYKELLEGTEQITAGHGLIWADRIPNKSDSWTKPFSQGTDQVDGSGFSMKIATESNTGRKDAAIGIGDYFYMTEANLGEQIFNALSSLVDSLEVNEEQRVIPDGAQFSSVGLSIWSRSSNGNDRNITSEVTIEISLAERSEGKLMLVYGCILADRVITQNEGELVDFIPGAPQALLSDGVKDGNIETSWWVKKDN